MAAYLFDTSALVAHFRGEEGGDRVQEILSDRASTILLSSVSIEELARCIHGLGFDAERARDAALSYASLAAEVIAVDTAIAIRAFELSSIASSRLPLADALIAASAQAAGAILVHRDLHYRALPRDMLEQLSLSER